MQKYKVGIVGATGMVGQRFISLLSNHPWFEITCLAASARSCNKTYETAVSGRWVMETPIPQNVLNMNVYDATNDIDQIVGLVDFVFCAVDMKKDEIKKLEEEYAKRECVVVSNNSAHRHTPDVPMIIPEINANHLDIIESQKKRLNTKVGFIAVKSNCSLQSYVPALAPILEYGIKDVVCTTYQAISGAGKTFDTWPEMQDNCIPYIGGEEEKSEKEPLKIFGEVKDNEIVDYKDINITSQCIRVACSDGHLAAVFIKFKDYVPTQDEILEKWNAYKGEPQLLNLPSAPKQFLHYFVEENRPQTKLDRNLENGMAISLGRLRKDSIFDYKFVGLSHNTLRGAAGGAVLLAELICAKGLIPRK